MLLQRKRTIKTKVWASCKMAVNLKYRIPPLDFFQWNFMLSNNYLHMRLCDQSFKK